MFFAAFIFHKCLNLELSNCRRLSEIERFGPVVSIGNVIDQKHQQVQSLLIFPDNQIRFLQQATHIPIKASIKAILISKSFIQFEAEVSILPLDN